MITDVNFFPANLLGGLVHEYQNLESFGSVKGFALTKG